MKKPEKIEEEFDVLFKQIGYSRVSDIVGASPDFSNADYINQIKKIVVELKILDKDFFKDGGVIDRLQTIVTVPKNVDEKGLGEFEFTLPEENRENKFDTIEEPLRRILKKANKQLRETIKRLLNGEGIGFVFIALNMNTPIDPEKIAELTAHLISKEFSSINGFIISTPSWGQLNNATGSIHPVCLPMTPFGCPEEIQLACN